jgi:hypothetical protein
MKKIILILIAVLKISFCQAQYSKEKLTQILTDGNVKSWTVKGTANTYSFNKNMTAEIKNDKGTVKADKWTLSSTDNIRWFIAMSGQRYELIVSYDKGGKQYIKLNSQSGDSKASGYAETILYPAAK